MVDGLVECWFRWWMVWLGVGLDGGWFGWVLVWMGDGLVVTVYCRINK